MNASTLTLEITQVATLFVVAFGWFKLWYEMKQKMALQNQSIKQLQTDCKLVKEEFDKLEEQVHKNKEDFSNQYNELSKEIGKVYTKIESTKLAIISEIHKIGK